MTLEEQIHFIDRSMRGSAGPVASLAYKDVSDSLKELGKLQDLVERYRQCVEILESGIRDLDGECLCINPPEDRNEAEAEEMGNDPENPSHHAMYCPVFLMATIEALESGKDFPT